MNYLIDLADALPWWVIVLILGVIVWQAIPRKPMRWPCAKCGEQNPADRLQPKAFCSKCGAPRPRGSAAVPVPIPLKSKVKISAKTRAAVRDILEEQRVADALPLGTIASATVRAEVPKGTTIAFAHETWLPEGVEHADGLPPFPKRPVLETLPDGIVLVEIDAVERTTGGMSSHFGYIGLFVSMLVSIHDRTVWDARADDAT